MTAADPREQISTVDPWAEARRQRIPVDRHSDRREWGLTYFRTGRISLRADLRPAEARSTLAHELIHLERGPACHGRHSRIEEQLVRRLTAMKLAPWWLWEVVDDDWDEERAWSRLGLEDRIFRTIRAMAAEV